MRLRHRKKGAVGDIDIINEVFLENQYPLINSLNDQSVIVDIGAHIGSFTLLLASKVKNAHIIAYEPNLSNFALLRHNIHINRDGNINCHNFAVSGKGGVLQLFNNPTNTGGHSLYHNNNSNLRTIPCISVTGKQIFRDNKLDRINLMKIDCEGAEYEFLLTMPKHFINKIDQILLEQHLTPSIPKKYQESSIISLFKSLNWEVITLKEIFYKNEGLFKIIYMKNKNT